MDIDRSKSPRPPRPTPTPIPAFAAVDRPALFDGDADRDGEIDGRAVVSPPLADDEDPVSVTESASDNHGIDVTDTLTFELYAKTLKCFRDCDCDWYMVIMEVVARPRGAADDRERAGPDYAVTGLGIIATGSIHALEPAASRTCQPSASDNDTVVVDHRLRTHVGQQPIAVSLSSTSNWKGNPPSMEPVATQDVAYPVGHDVPGL
ncbi:hypothetical protein NPX13_g9311 [Xylaria arbuscula]|uniref:Uncharacterized protein n=1 Tax=Xylaria arbuscula TaxID=114810 RepID=A0A9W8N6R6_9PEZI|nr:hypothetical protein NPX13_g9311 [Xylaria arbuscula]